MASNARMIEIAAPGPARLRTFGLVIGGLFGVIALWPTLMRGESPRLWALLVAGLLVVPALVAPTSLRRSYEIWMRLARVLGWVNTRLILAIGFYGVMTPVGLLMRFCGRDPMRRKFEQDLETYRVLRSPRLGTHLQRQF